MNETPETPDETDEQYARNILAEFLLRQLARRSDGTRQVVPYAPLLWFKDGLPKPDQAWLRGGFEDLARRGLIAIVRGASGRRMIGARLTELGQQVAAKLPEDC